MKRTELIEILKSKIKTLNCADFDELKDDLLTDEEGNPIPDSILVSETEDFYNRITNQINIFNTEVFNRTNDLLYNYCKN